MGDRLTNGAKSGRKIWQFQVKNRHFPTSGSCSLGHKLHTNADSRRGRWLQRPPAPVDQTIIPAQNRANSRGQWNYVAKQNPQFITRHRCPVQIARREGWWYTVLRNHIHTSVTNAGVGQWDPNCYVALRRSCYQREATTHLPALGDLLGMSKRGPFANILSQACGSTNQPTKVCAVLTRIHRTRMKKAEASLSCVTSRHTCTSGQQRQVR